MSSKAAENDWIIQHKNNIEAIISNNYLICSSNAISGIEKLDKLGSVLESSC